MLDYLNLNGLVDGFIPIGNACPFVTECELSTPFCPNGSNKNNDFSCAAARAFSLVSLRKKSVAITANNIAID